MKKKENIIIIIILIVMLIAIIGVSYAFNLCKKYINNLKRENKEIYVLKFDIKKYFYNIDHDVLLDRLDKIFVDKRIILLLKDIIYSSNMSYVNREIDSIIDIRKTEPKIP